jgi:UDP-N-acetylglucosamine 2-epimerase
MAPVIRALAADARFDSVVCAAGQHRQMLDQVLELFAIRPDHDLDVMVPNQTLSDLTSKLFAGIDRIVEHVGPDWVLAQGDTTTVMAAALVAFYRNVKFGHVEAGLRTGDRRRPFPEEINRRIADLVADHYFAPTTRAQAALRAEGVPDHRITVTGNTVVDALLWVADQPYDWTAGPLAGLPSEGPLVLVTAHRRESFGEPFRQLCQAIRECAVRYARHNVHFVYPVHLNPNVQAPVRAILDGVSNVTLIGTLAYGDLVHLMKRSTLILTDSGGIQEEGPSFGVPVLVMRDTTERPEGIEAGVATLVGTHRDRIVSEVGAALDRARHSSSSVKLAENPYGDGHAAGRIVNVLAGGTA